MRCLLSLRRSRRRFRLRLGCLSNRRNRLGRGVHPLLSLLSRPWLRRARGGRLLIPVPRALLARLRLRHWSPLLLPHAGLSFR